MSFATGTRVQPWRTRAMAGACPLPSLSSWTPGPMVGGRPTWSCWDLTVELARQQARYGRGRPDRKEGDDFQARVQDGFRHLAAADPLHWRVVDASGSVDEVAALVARRWNEPAPVSGSGQKMDVEEGLAGLEARAPAVRALRAAAAKPSMPTCLSALQAREN